MAGGRSSLGTGALARRLFAGANRHGRRFIARPAGQDRTESFEHPGPAEISAVLVGEKRLRAAGRNAGAGLQTARGRVQPFPATCASAAFAIGFAAEQILLGKADVMLAGGAEAPLHRSFWPNCILRACLGFHEEARRTCRPFDATRNGLVLGEGGAFWSSNRPAPRTGRGNAAWRNWPVGLQPRTTRAARGVNEDGSGLIEVMRQALQMAGLAAEQIDYINAHGSGTKLNDRGRSAGHWEIVRRSRGNRTCTRRNQSPVIVSGATPALEAALASKRCDTR